MDKQYLKGLVTKKAGGKYHILASTSGIDRQGEVIDQKGWDLADFKTNPIALYGHDYGADTLPIGRYENIEVTTLGLEMDLVFASAEASPLAAQIKALYDENVLNAFSVGFIAKERSGNMITKSQLLEVSAVKVPANAQAVMLMRGMKGIGDEVKQEIEEAAKGAVSEQLTAEQILDQKYAYLNSVFDIVYAFCDVFMDANSTVDSFGTLLTETAGLLATLASNPTPEDSDDEKAIKELRGDRAVKFFIAAHGQKIGAAISSKNKISIQTALDHMGSAVSVLGDVLAQPASDDEGGKEQTVSELITDPIVQESLKVEPQAFSAETQKEILFDVQKRLQISAKQTEKGLEIVKDALGNFYKAKFDGKI